MRTATGIVSLALLALGIPAYGQNQPPGPQMTPAAPPTAQTQGRSPGGDIGSGAGDIGKGAGKGVGDLAEGTGKGAVDLVTLHPLNAAGEVGKGGAKAGKNVVVGTAKGTGKIVKGAGRAIKHIF